MIMINPLLSRILLKINIKNNNVSFPLLLELYILIYTLMLLIENFGNNI